MDPQALLALLAASIDASDPAARRAAEDQLAAAARQPGFAPLLAQAALEGGLPVPLRQLAAVVLKNTCAKRWQEGERGFEPPQVRARGPPGGDPAMAAGAVAAGAALRGPRPRTRLPQRRARRSLSAPGTPPRRAAVRRRQGARARPAARRPRLPRIESAHSGGRRYRRHLQL
jgi:hypothetical protein